MCGRECAGGGGGGGAGGEGMCVVQPCIEGQYPNFDCNGESTHVEKRIWSHASPECSCQGLRAGI